MWRDGEGNVSTTSLKAVVNLYPYAPGDRRYSHEFD
jgi:hypothetical protein